MNEIANKKENALKAVSDNTYEQFLGANFPDIEEKTKIAFLEMARAFNLNPFKREIYLVGYKGKKGDSYNIIVGYEVYISRAMASGMLDGFQVDSKIEKTTRFNTNTGQFEEISDLVATCTIWRKDFSQPFKKSVNFSEYAQKTFDYQTKTYRINAMWAEKSKTMLEKVALAQGLRWVFPAEVGGLGYQAEELGHNSAENYILAREVAPDKPAQSPAPQDFSQTLDFIEESEDIDYLNSQLSAYLHSEHKNPEIKRAIWLNAKQNGYYYDDKQKQFFPDSPIIEDDANNNDFEALDAYRIRLNTASNSEEIKEISQEICAKYGEGADSWPKGLIEMLNEAAKKVREQPNTQFDEEVIF